MDKLKEFSYKIIIFTTVIIVFVFNAASIFAVDDLSDTDNMVFSQLFLNNVLYIPDNFDVVPSSDYPYFFVYYRSSDKVLRVIYFNSGRIERWNNTSEIVFNCPSSYTFNVSCRVFKSRFYLNGSFTSSTIYYGNMGTFDTNTILYSNTNLYDSSGNLYFPSTLNANNVVFSNYSTYKSAYDSYQHAQNEVEISNNILSNIKNILKSIAELPSTIVDGIGNFLTILGNKIENLWTSVKDGFSGLGVTLISVWDSLKNLPSDIWEKVKEIPKLILDGLEGLFIPTDGYFFTFYNDIKVAFDNRVPFISQIMTLCENILGVFNNSVPTNTPPDFTITLYGSTMTIWDWDWFDKYKSTIQNIILVVIYIPWGIKMYKKLPGLIKGLPDNFSYQEGILFDNKTGEVYSDHSKGD